MPTSRIHAGLLAVSLVSLPALRAQETLVAAAATPADPARAAGQGAVLSGGIVPVHEVEYGTWAAGDGYKASFHDAMTFIPYLGVDYPHNQPLTWRTVGARVGAQVLMEEGEEAARWHSDDRYEYRYRALTEAYDVRAEGLEQTFVVHRRPSGSGDLVVTGRITTQMHAEPVESEHGPLVFADDEGRELVRYGAAWAIDAEGRKTNVSTSHGGNTITLAVPGTWLRKARFPVTIDPLLGPQGLATAFTAVRGLDRCLDVSYDLVNDVGMVVYIVGSGADTDVVGRLFDRNTNSLGSPPSVGTVVFSDLDPGSRAEGPRVACTGTGQTFCIAYESTHFAIRAKRVRYHVHPGGSTAFSSSVQQLAVSASSGEHHWRPDVGGTLPGTPGTRLQDKFVLVYQRELAGPFAQFANTANSQIRAAILGANGSVLYQRLLRAAVSGADQERPSVNQQAEPASSLQQPTDWFVTWQEHDNGASNAWHVAGRKVDGNGAVSSGSWRAASRVTTHHNMDPAVAGAEGRYLVAFATYPTSLLPGKPSAVDGRAIAVRRVDWPAGTSTPSQGAETVLWGPGPVMGQTYRVGGCAFDSDTRSHWVIEALGGTPTSHDLHVAKVGYTGRYMEATTVVRGSNVDDIKAGGVTYDAIHGEFWVAYAALRSCFAYCSYQVHGRRFVYNTTGPTTVSGRTCQTAAISWEGSQQIGSEFPRVRLTGASPNQLAFLLIAVGTADLDLGAFGMPGCRLLVPSSGPRFLGLVTEITDVVGHASYQQLLPEFLSPGTLRYQWFHVQPGANAANFVNTQRLSVPIIR